MNGGSELEFAVACFHAGIMPSLYCDNKHKDFQNKTGSDLVVVAVYESIFLERDVQRLVDDGVRYIEIIPFVPYGNIQTPLCSEEKNQFASWSMEKKLTVWKEILHKTIKKYPDIHFQKRIYFPTEEHVPFIPCLKGNDAAGISFGTGFNTMQLFCEQKKAQPDIDLLPYGGIGTADDVAEYINLGARAVAVGTIIAISEESPLSLQTKIKMIENQSKLERLPDTLQNSLILGNKDTVVRARSSSQDWNRHDSLRSGQYGNGTVGHVYMGHGIRSAYKIKPIKDIVQELVSKIS